MKNITLAAHAVRPAGTDKIFAASQKARAAIREFGEAAVINSTLGECLDDDGKLMVLPTVERLLRKMPVEEICSYAPIAGVEGFNEAVQISLFGKIRDDCFIESVATPGGCGALRHAIWNFLDEGDCAITTNYHWGPYKGICQEHDRRLDTFEMFDACGKFNLDALDRKIAEVAKKQKQILIILNTPANNPTGYSMSKGEMEQAIAIIKRYAEDKTKNITLCLDVSYIDFAGEFAESRAVFEPVRDLPDNMMVVVVFSMSKSFTMCGMRCGALVCLGTTKESATVFKEAMSFSSRSTWSNVVRSAQKVLTDICLDPELKLQVDGERLRFKEIISERGNAFLEAANRAGLNCCPYKHGYFITIPCENPEYIAEQLQKRLVFIVPMAGGIRFSPCAVTKEKCLRAPEIIKEVLGE